MDPDPQTAVAAALEGQAIIDVAGVVIVDGDAVLAAQIQPCGIARLLQVNHRQQPLCFRQKLWREAATPGGARQRQQPMPVPLAQFHQQVAQITAISAQMQGTQALPQGRLQLVGFDPAGGELLQLLEPLTLLRRQGFRIHRLPAPQQGLPALFALGMKLTPPPLTP